MNELTWGIIFLIFGIVYLIWKIKEKNDNDSSGYIVQGYGISILSILVGIVILLRYFFS